MDIDSKNELERILALDKSQLLQGDIEFIQARRAYLNDAQRERYADILEGLSVETIDNPDKEDEISSDDPAVPPAPVIPDPANIPPAGEAVSDEVKNDVAADDGTADPDAVPAEPAAPQA